MILHTKILDGFRLLSKSYVWATGSGLKTSRVFILLWEYSGIGFGLFIYKSGILPQIRPYNEIKDKVVFVRK